MTAASDLDLILVYDFDPASRAVGRRAAAGAEPVLRAPDAAADHRAVGADRGGRCSTRSTCACGRPARRGRSRRSSRASSTTRQRGLDLGAHGADARARRSPGRRGSRRASRRRSAARWCSRATAPRSRPTCATCASASPRRRAPSDIWDLKQVRGGLVDLEFIAQYLQLVHAASHPEVLDQNTVGALPKLRDAGVLAPAARRDPDPRRQPGPQPDPGPAPVPRRPLRPRDRAERPQGAAGAGRRGAGLRPPGSGSGQRLPRSPSCSTRSSSERWSTPFDDAATDSSLGRRSILEGAWLFEEKRRCRRRRC